MPIKAGTILRETTTTELGLEIKCSRCKEFWPATIEFYSKSGKSGILGFSYWCKACYNEWRNNR